MKDLKEGKSVAKPIYNHVTGLLDPAETIESPKILVIEGLHPFYDKRVRDLLDFKVRAPAAWPLRAVCGCFTSLLVFSSQDSRALCVVLC